MADSPAAAAGPPDGVDAALAARALAWLAQREYSRQELRNKLMGHRAQSGRAKRGGERREPGAIDDEPAPDHVREPDTELVDHRSQARSVDAVLDWLERNQHLSQQRFVESRLHLRSERFGNARIRQELAQHGVSMSAELDASLRASEFDRARAVWQRKFGTRLMPASAADAAKQMRFLARRGFSGDVIRRVLREVEAATAAITPAGAEAGTTSFVGVASPTGALARPRARSQLRLIAGGLKKPVAD